MLDIVRVQELDIRQGNAVYYVEWVSGGVDGTDTSDNYGGQTAAPVFKQIAEAAANYLNIRPENADEPSMPEVSASDDFRNLKTAAVRTP